MFGSGNPRHDIPQLLSMYREGVLEARRADHQPVLARRREPGLPGHARRQEHPWCHRVLRPPAEPSATTRAGLRAGAVGPPHDRRRGAAPRAGVGRRRPRLPAGTCCWRARRAPGSRPCCGPSPTRRDIGFEFVEGNAELTPAPPGRARSTPRRSWPRATSPDVFVDGPLLSALRDGSLLYVEEINRMPEETLNVLITVMSEGEVHVPRLGRGWPRAGFPAGGRHEPLRRRGHGQDRLGGLRPLLPAGHGLPVRGRGAGDRGGRGGGPAPGLLPGPGCSRPRWPWSATAGSTPTSAPARRSGAPSTTPCCAASWPGCAASGPSDPSVTLDAAQLALSGRLRLREGCPRSPEDVVEELWAAHFGPGPGGEPEEDGDAGSGRDRREDQGKA